MTALHAAEALAIIDDAPWSATTLRHYRAALRQLRIWCDAVQLPPDRLTDEGLSWWIDQASSSPSATRITLAAVGAAYASRGDPSPAGAACALAARHQARQHVGRVPAAISPADLRQLVARTSSHEVCAAACVAWHGALRIGELESLGQGGTWELRGDELALVVVGKTGPRIVRIARGVQPWTCALAWVESHPPSPAWATIRGRLARALRAAGLPTQTHAFRRGWATEAARRGVSAAAISLYLGHADARAALAYVGAAALDAIPPLT